MVPSTGASIRLLFGRRNGAGGGELQLFAEAIAVFLYDRPVSFLDEVAELTAVIFGVVAVSRGVARGGGGEE